MNRNIVVGWIGVFLCIFNIIFINLFATFAIFAIPFWIYISYKTLIKNQKLQKWTWFPVGLMIFLQIFLIVCDILSYYLLAY